MWALANPSSSRASTPLTVVVLVRPIQHVDVMPRQPDAQLAYGTPSGVLERRPMDTSGPAEYLWLT